ncbi:MAG: hypothetical protein MUF76_00920 [Hydrogenophaga sp.]|jgi:hypothetical protein|nr:hypothetical protein [Hydrogenophaga sp.]
MFDRIKNAMNLRRAPPATQPQLQAWADARGLNLQGRKEGGFSLAGAWNGHLFRAECAPSTRNYIRGFELKARVELSVQPEVGLVLMNRALKSTFEAQANALFEDVTDPLETRARQVPEEVRWLSLYRDAGWTGPPAGFWSRYAVLTDTAEVARESLNEALVTQLMQWPAHQPEGAPMLYVLDSGSTYLRLQMDRSVSADVAVHALDVLGLFSAQVAKVLAPR